jgi:cyanate lyase
MLLKELSPAAVSRRVGHSNAFVAMRFYAHALVDTEELQAKEVDTLLIERR